MNRSNINKWQILTKNWQKISANFSIFHLNYLLKKFVLKRLQVQTFHLRKIVKLLCLEHMYLPANTIQLIGILLQPPPHNKTPPHSAFVTTAALLMSLYWKLWTSILSNLLFIIFSFVKCTWAKVLKNAILNQKLYWKKTPSICSSPNTLFGWSNFLKRVKYNISKLRKENGWIFKIKISIKLLFLKKKLKFFDVYSSAQAFEKFKTAWMQTNPCMDRRFLYVSNGLTLLYKGDTWHNCEFLPEKSIHASLLSTMLVYAI